MCVTWLIHMCEMNHSYARMRLRLRGGVAPCVWWKSFMCVTWLIHMCDMTHSHVWPDSFICVTWLIHMCDMPHPHVWHDSFICVTRFISMYPMTHSYVWHDSLSLILDGTLWVEVPHYGLRCHASPFEGWNNYLVWTPIDFIFKIIQILVMCKQVEAGSRAARISYMTDTYVCHVCATFDPIFPTWLISWVKGGTLRYLGSLVDRLHKTIGLFCKRAL